MIMYWDVFQNAKPIKEMEMNKVQIIEEKMVLAIQASWLTKKKKKKKTYLSLFFMLIFA